MSDLERFKEFVKWFEELVFGTPIDKPKNKLRKRARNKDGTYTDKSNASVNVNQVPDTVSFTWQYTKDIV